MNMKKDKQLKIHLRLAKVFSFLVVLALFGFQAMAQSITINAEPTGPLVVGQPIDVDYTAIGFSANAVFYLEIGGDSIIASNTSASGTLTAVVPGGYDGVQSIRVFGATGDPDGLQETRPVFGELTISGSTSSYQYGDDTYTLYFWEPTIRRVQFPEMDVNADTAYLEFDYKYDDFADTLDIVVEYSTNGGSSYSPLDTVEYQNILRFNDFQVGLPVAARTSNTTLRIRQLYSEYNNDDYEYDYYIYNPSVVVGEAFGIEGQSFLTGSPFTVNLPFTNVNNVYAPGGDPYFGNTYLGDSIYIDADMTGFTADVKFEIVYNASGNHTDPVYKLADYAMENIAGDNYLFKGVLPDNIPFNDGYYFWVVPYKGTAYEHGTNTSEDFTDSDEGNYTLTGGSLTADGAYFTAANKRELLSPEWIISEEGTLLVDVSRHDNIFYPDNAELIVEYATDGSTFIEMGTINLNSARHYNDGSTVFEITVPSGAISNNTQFRIRQRNINNENLDRYYISYVELMLNSNRLAEGTEADYAGNLDSDYVNDPNIDFKSFTIPDDLFYPGTPLTLEYEVTVGNFPAGTEMQAIIDLSGRDMVLGTNSTDLVSGDIATNIPAVLDNTYTLRILGETPAGTASSNMRYITIEQTDLEILTVTGKPEREVDGNPYLLRGDSVIVTYNLTGEAPAGVQLQIWDNGNGKWLTIGNDNPADESVTGYIPTDVTFTASPNIRLALSDSVYTNSLIYTYDRYPDKDDFPENENDSMFLASQGYLNPDNYDMTNPTFARAGTRFIETKGFNTERGAHIYAYLYLLDDYWLYEDEVDKATPVLLEYSVDNGATWKEIAEWDHADYSGSRSGVSRSLYIPIEAQSTNTKFRIIQDKDNVLSFGENAWTIDRFYVRTYEKTQITSSSYALNLQSASISLGTLAKSEYAPGEPVTVPYNITGSFGPDVSFAVIVTDNNNVQYVVDTSSATGQVQLNTSLPVNLPEDNYELRVYPYDKSLSQYPVIDYLEDLLDDEENFLLIEGGHHDAGSDLELYKEGRRSVLTNALPQLDGDSLLVEFDIDFDETVFPAEGVFVELTTDGGATFSTIDTVWEDDIYEFAIANADITDQTHVRLVQYVNFDQNRKDWDIDAFNIKSPDNNLITGGSYTVQNWPQNFRVYYPDVPGEFSFNVQEEVLYTTDTFALEFEIIEGMYAPQLPDETEYIFYLGLSDEVYVDFNGDSAMLGKRTGTGAVDLIIPETVYQNSYQVLLKAMIADPDADEPFVYFENEELLTLDIYNPLLKTIAATKEVYRGNDMTVNWELQTGSITTDDYYFHLKLSNEIIHTQKGASASFTTQVPTDANHGNRDAEIILTRDSIWVEGKSIELNEEDDDEWRDGGQHVFYNSSYTRLKDVAGANRAVSQDFVMTNGGSLNFGFDYAKNTGMDFLESMKVHIEYSNDGGSSYQLLDIFPNENYKLGDGEVNQMYYFAPGEIGDTVRFRVSRENGDYNNVYLHDFTIVENSNEAPVNTVSDNLTVFPQTITLGDMPRDICPGTAMSMDLDIKGEFGEKVVHRLQYYINDAYQGYFPDVEITGLTQGTSQFDFMLPEGWPGGDYAFRIKSYDATTDNPFTVYSARTEEAIYLIPTINFTGTTVSGDVKLCAEDAESYQVYSTQQFFKYQARDVASGELYGDPVISENGGTVSLQTENITEDLELEIVVTAMNEAGTKTCATGVLNDRIAFDYVPERTLFANDNSGSVWLPVDSSYAVCEGNPDNLRLQAGYYNKDGSYVSGGLTSIGWYRDNESTSVASGQTLGTFNQTGSYFAKVVADGCEYTTAPVDIDVLSVPDKPTVALTGETTVCDGETVMLSMNETNPYYRWYGGSNGTTQMSGSSKTIEVTKSGVYRAVASDYPFEQNCPSAKSDPIEITVIEEPSTNLQVVSAPNGIELSEDHWLSCGEEVNLRVNNEPNTYTWTLNGAAFSSTDDNDEIMATQTGTYNVRSIKTENGVTCVFAASDSIYVEITDEVPQPALTFSGDSVFCSGEGSATITATEGYAGYVWYKDNNDMNVVVNGNPTPSSENVISPVESGRYKVMGVDGHGCMSDISKSVDVTILPMPDMSGNMYALEPALCGEGPAEIRVDVSNSQEDRLLTYQLIDMATNQPSGQPGTVIVDESGNHFIKLISDDISESTEFGVLVSDQSANGCSAMLNDKVAINVQTAEIEIVGNRLCAPRDAYEYQWYRNGEAILGYRGDDRCIEVFDAAEYSVMVTFRKYVGGEYVYCELPASMMKSATGIDELLISDDIRCYPNPVENNLSIEIDNEYRGDIQLKVTDITGRTLYTNNIYKRTKHHVEEIRTESFQPGFYFVNFIVNDKTIVKSIVKE